MAQTKASPRTVALLGLLLGGFFIFFSFVARNQYKRESDLLESCTVETKAQVTKCTAHTYTTHHKVNGHRKTEIHTDYKLDLSYSADGKEHTGKQTVSEPVNEGSYVMIKYDPASPDRFILSSYSADNPKVLRVTSIVMLVIGIGIIIASAIGFIRMSGKRRIG
ncbi:MAG: hypothetical protein IJ737_05070 [Ruminococcus sp.]|nr:hypothetical protein [Ruminococcus sp.]